MERFDKKPKNLKPIESVQKILENIGIAQFANAELSDNEKKQKDSENNLSFRRHRGGSVPSVFEKMKKSHGPNKDDIDSDDLPESHTHPMDGE